METDAIKNVLDTYRKAVYEQDLPLFMSIYADDVLVFDAWDRWEYAGVDEWRSMPSQWFADLAAEGVRVRVDFSNLRVVTGTDAAVAHGDAAYTAVDAAGKDLRGLINRFTAALTLRGGLWKIVHEHTSLPFDFSSGQPVKKR